MKADMDQKLKVEKDFHNQRFNNGDNRQSQKKYYWAVQDGANYFAQMVRDASKNSEVLEYGCGDTKSYLTYAPIAKKYDAIDISDIAIDRLNKENTHDHVKFHVMDAMNMDFDDNSFDLVHGCGIIHHLDIEKSMNEVSRVLKTGGKAIFWEPLGLNPVINLYRMITPSARTPDEHPLLPKDFRTIENYFLKVDIKFYGLTTLAAVPIRNKSIGKQSFKILSGIDQAIFKIPYAKNMAWYCVLTCTMPSDKNN